LDAPDAELDAAVGERVRRMMADGLIEEVRGLAAAGLRQGRTASRAVGYAQGLAVLDGTMSESEAGEAIALATRQLVRRQRRWFRRDPRIAWVRAGAAALDQAWAALEEVR
ncbi:MAG: tRNA (adenosine(37)-N6)-dimethylallyltransferase MiaA, partial [Bifidobacteriaceae bacterium]|nr:tRNA (adenosine(37)-N6)-dimethylallyltransferase MiaA [Bifidobacteriaceae bacterium]